VQSSPFNPASFNNLDDGSHLESAVLTPCSFEAISTADFSDCRDGKRDIACTGPRAEVCGARVSGRVDTSSGKGSHASTAMLIERSPAGSEGKKGSCKGAHVEIDPVEFEKFSLASFFAQQGWQIWTGNTRVVFL
jgi:hypothetical protein